MATSNFWVLRRPLNPPSSPADLQLFRHVIADVAKLPVLEVVSAVHFVADPTLGLGEFMHDYLAD